MFPKVSDVTNSSPWPDRDEDECRVGGVLTRIARCTVRQDTLNTPANRSEMRVVLAGRHRTHMLGQSARIYDMRRHRRFFKDGTVFGAEQYRCPRKGCRVGERSSGGVCADGLVHCIDHTLEVGVDGGYLFGGGNTSIEGLRPELQDPIPGEMMHVVNSIAQLGWREGFGLQMRRRQRIRQRDRPTMLPRGEDHPGPLTEKVEDDFTSYLGVVEVTRIQW